MRVKKIKDLVERAGWTGLETAAGSIIAVLTGATIGWEAGLKVVGISTLIAICKVVVAQKFGKTEDGAAIPGGVIEPT